MTPIEEMAHEAARRCLEQHGCLVLCLSCSVGLAQRVAEECAGMCRAQAERDNKRFGDPSPVYTSAVGAALECEQAIRQWAAAEPAASEGAG